MPDLRTISHWMDGADKSEWYSQSTLMAQHTKAGSFERRFAIVMNENFRLTSDLETYVCSSGSLLVSDDGWLGRYVFNTQIMQSEAIGYAYQMWRRAWHGRGKEYVCCGVDHTQQVRILTDSVLLDFWCSCLAVERLLASYFLGDRGLLCEFFASDP